MEHPHLSLCGSSRDNRIERLGTLVLACCRASVLCAAAIVAGRAAFAETLAPREAIALIEGFETKTRLIEYRCDLTSGIFESPDAPSAFRTRNTEMASSFVRWDFERDRFFVHIDAIQPAVTHGNAQAGKPLFYSSQSEFVNDTRVLQAWYRGVVANESPVVPDENARIHPGAQQGMICAATDEAIRQQRNEFLAVRSLQVGFGWVPQNVWSRHEPPQRLSAFLRGKHEGGDDVTVQSTETGSWLIHVAAEKTSQIPYEWKLTFDPQRGRPLKAEWGSTTGDNSPEWNVSTRATYEYATESDLFPQRVVLVELLGAPRGYEWLYRDVAINRAVSNSDFQLKFPEGVEVTDHVAKSTYVVGKSTADDVESVRRYMENEVAKPPVHISPRSAASKAILLVNLAVLLIIGVVIAWRRYGRRGSALPPLP